MPKCCRFPKYCGRSDTKSQVRLLGIPKTDDKKRLWLRVIRSEDFTPSQRTKVCQKPFTSDDIEHETTFCNKTTKETLRAQLKRPRPKGTVVLSVLPGRSAYLFKKNLEQSKPTNSNSSQQNASVNSQSARQYTLSDSKISSSEVPCLKVRKLCLEGITSEDKDVQSSMEPQPSGGSLLDPNIIIKQEIIETEEPIERNFDGFQFSSVTNKTELMSDQSCSSASTDESSNEVLSTAIGSSSLGMTDDFDDYGKYIASELRNLDKVSCLYVQSKFADILLQARAGKFRIKVEPE